MQCSEWMEGISKKELKIYMTLSRENINALIDRATGLKKTQIEEISHIISLPAPHGSGLAEGPKGEGEKHKRSGTLHSTCASTLHNVVDDLRLSIHTSQTR